jgi:hypothetical protein
METDREVTFAKKGGIINPNGASNPKLADVVQASVLAYENDTVVRIGDESPMQ